MINQEKGVKEQTPPFSNKKRKILASVMFIFAVAIGLYVGLRDNGNSNSTRSNTTLNTDSVTNNNTGTNGNKTVSDVKAVNYDGTYTGTFNYEYQDSVTMTETYYIGPWTPASFTLTLTFKTVGKSASTVDPNPVVYLDVTNAIVSDPGFGTGSGGVNPVASQYNGGEQSAWMPLHPANQDARSAFLGLYFPDFGFIDVPMFAGDGPLPIIVSPDGRTISSNPDWVNPDPKCTGNPCGAWEASGRHGGDFSFDAPRIKTNNRWAQRLFKYGNWSLTKISD